MRVRLGFLLGLALVSACKEPRRSSPDDASAASVPVVAASTSAAPRPAHAGPVKPRPSASAETSVAGSVVPEGTAARASPSSVGLPPVTFGPPGPIVLRGYPAELPGGSRDFADHVGFTADGEELFACGSMVPQPEGVITELGESCFYRRRTGGTVHLSGVEEKPDGAKVSRRYLDKVALYKQSAIAKLAFDGTRNAWRPPPVTASWPYASDITLVLDVKESGALTVGGSVGGRPPVFPVTLAVRSPNADALPFIGIWNAVLASPDGKELGFVGHFYCMEWCNEVALERFTYGALASLVFNDTGFSHHQRKEYAASRDLFLKATWANPAALLPPYNLACAYARLKDEPNAAKALELAVALGGDAVKRKALADADFEGVRAAAWFRTLTRTR